ncbi:MAG: hypothetical protein IPM17_15435 [Verrucomicrobia bacterium]|nr:hypothetical protein [Verrucomicrobiota bacterium]
MKNLPAFLLGALLAPALVVAQPAIDPNAIPDPPEDAEGPQSDVIAPPADTVPAPAVTPPVTVPQIPAFPTPRTTSRATNAARPAATATVPQIPAPPTTRTVPTRGAATTTPAAGVPAPAIPTPVAGGGPVAGGAAGVGAGNAGGAPIVPQDGNFGALPPDAILPKGTLTRLQSTPLEQVFAIYAEVTGRIILRPNQLPAAAITLDASQRELTKAEAIQALDSVLTLNGITMIPVGDKFVTAVPSTQALQEAAKFTDLEAADLPEAGQYVTKIVTVTNLLPSEVMPLIQGFSKTQNGIVPIDSSMTLVLRDYAANIKRMMEIIEKVDVKKEDDLKLEVIPIRYGTVDEIYETMSSLIGGGGGGAAATGGAGTMGARRTGGATGFGGARGSTFGRGGIGGFGGMGGYGGYGGYGGSYGSRFGSGGYYPQQVATTPGQPGAVGSTTFQNRLQNVVSRMTGQQREVQMLESAKIVPDRRSNSLIVYANKKDMEMITNMVAKVDVLLAQVLIEAIIMEVKLTGDFEFGVSAYFKDKSGDWSSEGVMNPGGLLNTLTNLGSSSGNNFTYLGRYRDDVTMVVKALSSNGRGEILATPRIQTSHAMAASFSVGETVPYVSGTYSYGLGTTPSTTYTQLPVISELSVTPYITPDGLVVMDVTQTIQDISGFKRFDVGELPITVERNAQATISVQDQDTIILGGYIRNSRTRSKSGVPVLKDIPLLGAAFRSSSDNKARSEMVVFLKPTVLNSPRDAALLATREQDRLPGLRRMNAEMETEMEKLERKVDRETNPKSRKQSKNSP